MALSLSQIILPKRKANPKGASSTSTFNASSSDQVLAAPDFRQHLRDIFTDRTSQDARQLITDLLKFDSDTSATLHAFLTISDTPLRVYAYDENGQLDPAGQEQLDALRRSLFQRSDYSTGFEFTNSQGKVSEDLRYCILWRGACAAELLFDKLLIPNDFRIVDPGELYWYEKQPGLYKPEQRPKASSDKLQLDIPTLFVKYHRQNPTELYPQSPFVSSINTIAARQQVINDLYRIMQKTGYPRIELTVLEDVLRKNAPAEIAGSEAKMTTWLRDRLNSVAADVATMRPDAVYVHTDAVESKILNEKGPGTAMDVTSIIDVLNAQNQAALKTMSSIIGRGESGVNTSTVEARIFSLSAQALNTPVADLFSDAFTLAMRLTGYSGYVVCRFDDVELRPKTELEAMLTMRQSRMMQNLSLGLITDAEYHIEIFNRPPPTGSPTLSGTGFMPMAGAAGVDAGSASPNSDPLGRSITPSDNKSAKSNTVKRGK